MASQPHIRLSPEEYLKLERKAEFKSEYSNGFTYLMAGASEKHNTITLNVASSLLLKLRGRCRTYSNDMKVWVEDWNKFFYPDVVVVCGKLQFFDDNQDALLNPTLIIEVLSESTERYDKGDKFLAYQQLDSLLEYILIAQEKPVVEQYSKREDGSWTYHALIGLESVLNFCSAETALSLHEIYAEVNWETDAT